MARTQTSAERSSRTPETVAVLGAGGTMGFAMARNIARAGIAVRAWNRTRRKAEPLAADGAYIASTPPTRPPPSATPCTTRPAAASGTCPLPRQAPRVLGLPIKGGNTMPRTRRRGLARAGELPGTLKRSSKEAQETYTKAHDSAVRAYGEGDQADRATYAEFKRKFEKRGDHWIPKRPAG